MTLFFGLSGTGKTTLSADVHRNLIGDDEHCWSNDGVFNIEGGCYAKCIDLSREREPEIFDAIRFGSVLENVVVDHVSREVDYTNCSVTENTRCAYPIEYIPNARIPCMAGHPKNIVFLTCDAFGVLPPVSKLTTAQAMYHFISGYTAKVAGTEEGVREPTATFSACFGQPFLVWHPTKYAQMLADKIHSHSVNVWLVNTGWIGGGYGVGQRIPLRYSRAIIDAIHSGELSERTEYETAPIFNLAVPMTCTGVPSNILHPERCWADKAAYQAQLCRLAQLFKQAFATYHDKATAEMLAGQPILCSD